MESVTGGHLQALGGVGIVSGVDYSSLERWVT